jgi:hypothetical protein
MKNETSYHDRFTKAMLTGLFAGIIATVVCLGYNIFYREHTGFPLASIINVSSLIFFVNILFVIIGIIYYGFIQSKKGDLAFTIVFILLTVFFCWRALYSHRSDEALLNNEFHHLLIAMIIIMGIAASIGIPLLFHSKKFEEHVL